MRNYGLDKYKRLLWIIYENHGYNLIGRKQLEKYIILEIGTCWQTRDRAITQLKKIGWLKQKGANGFHIGEDAEF